MKMNTKRVFFILSLLCFMSISLLGQHSNRLIPFRAYLTDVNNNPIPSAVYNIRFQLYNAPTGGMSVWSETLNNVSVINGQISIYLGQMNPIKTDIDFTANRYLGIKINDNVEMLPRFQLIPSFHSFAATTAKTAELAGYAKNAIDAIKADKANSALSATNAETVVSAVQAQNVDLATNTIKFNSLDPSHFVLQTELTALKNRLDTLERSSIPTGTVLAFTIDTADVADDSVIIPHGYFECAGQELPKSEYLELYLAIGGRYGQTTSNFNLPDYRGRFLRAWNDGKEDNTAPDVDDRTNSAGTAEGGLIGDHVGTRQEDGVYAHNHDFSTGYPKGNHYHKDTYFAGSHNTTIAGGTSGSTWVGSRAYTSGPNNQPHTHNGTTDVNTDAETTPVNKTVMYIIKY